jgi:hypothetical protein
MPSLFFPKLENVSYVKAVKKLSLQNKVWINGPVMNYARQTHSCAMIRKDDRNPSLSVIAVGGENNGDFKNSVEILDENTFHLAIRKQPSSGHLESFPC